MVKVRLKKEQVKNILKEAIDESEWGFHFGNSHNGRPYVSDNKFQMIGRETGHFGSGTYFSTYRGNSDVERYRGNRYSSNPNFIEIADRVYRVDFELYKNLYRVRSERQGNVLYTMMRNLNAFYNRICADLGKFSPKYASYDNATRYQIIKRNADALNLKCPSYLELVRMAQRHGSDEGGVQSFSTLFMEWNGYNGVNVSGVDFYDNTKHGSVIYDLSKVNTDMEEVEPNSLFTGFGYSPYDDSVVRGYNDPEIEAIDGQYITWVDKLNDMPLSRALRVLKNYTESGNVLKIYSMGKMNDDLARRYLMLLYNRKPTDRWGKSLLDELIGDSRFAELVEKYGAYYWLNYKSENEYDSVLIELLRWFDYKVMWEDDREAMKKAYLDRMLSYMKRDLTEYEKEHVREEYLNG